MLITRVITALVLLAILLSVLFFGSFVVFSLTVIVFLAAAIWESARLFGSSRPIVHALLCALIFGLVLSIIENAILTNLLLAACVAIWILRLAPTLIIGLPNINSVSDRLLQSLYSIAIFGCFVAVFILFRHSPFYLLSVMTIIWVADIGAYFSGKAFGKHKLAPSISPGKSWEGLIGGGLAVLLFAGIALQFPAMENSFVTIIYNHWGSAGFIVVMTVLVLASVVGDLFESLLKRRAGIKDSSNLLPGHGGVLDRIDALIPTMPLAVLIESWL